MCFDSEGFDGEALNMQYKLERVVADNTTVRKQVLFLEAKRGKK
jgi:hypothetical protein